METFGGADYDNLADVLFAPSNIVTRPMESSSTIPVAPRDPQWMIYWENDIATALSPWSRNVSHSLNAVAVKELQIYTRKFRKTLFKAASTDRGLEKRLRGDLPIASQYRLPLVSQGEGSIYSQAPNGSQGSLPSASTSNLMSIPEVLKGEEWDTSTPTPTGNDIRWEVNEEPHEGVAFFTFFKTSPFIAKNNIVIQDASMTRTKASRVSSCRSQSRGKSCCAQGPPAICAV
ncbi:hypothetical protein CPB85DRAFT_1561478 [Mucidula mucida]|nr:hypothetical protein CPB85DRAFT_1561478 [Mucidula mucida]